MAPTELYIDGYGAVYQYPERGILNLTVSTIHPDQTLASTEVHKTARMVQERVQELSPRGDYGLPTIDAPVVDWSTESVSTRSLPGLSATNYSASIKMMVRFQDFEKLGGFAAWLSTVNLVNVDGVEWIILPQTGKELRATALSKAYLDALSKARTYAGAMGKHDIRPIRVTDGGLASNPHHALQDFQMQFMLLERQNRKRLEMAKHETSTLQTAGGVPQQVLCVPQSVSFSATCNVTFELE